MPFLKGFGQCCGGRGPTSGNDEEKDEVKVDINNNNVDDNVDKIVGDREMKDHNRNALIEAIRHKKKLKKDTKLFEPIEVLQKVLRFTSPEMIGHGAFGKVFKAYQTIGTELDEKPELVAIKTISFGSKAYGFRWRRYIEEIEMMRSLDHPNIVKFRNNFEVYHDTEYNDGFIVEQNQFETTESIPNLKLTAIVMDHLGPDLLQFRGRYFLKCFKEPLIRLIFEQIGSALVYLHDCHQLAHQDLKEDNIVFGQVRQAEIDMDHMNGSNVQMKLVDFGNARYVTTDTNRKPFDTDTVTFGRFLIESALPNYSNDLPIGLLIRRFMYNEDREQQPNIKDGQFRSVLVEMTSQKVTLSEALKIYYESNLTTESSKKEEEEELS